MAANDILDSTLHLSHIELFVEDLAGMEAFYTRVLGFVVTDREPGGGMVFLSRNPAEHHQLVLNPAAGRRGPQSPLDHISFRVESLQNLQARYRALVGRVDALEAVSHGNSWSVYFRDPDGNRLELFADTPWHVNQPCRFEIDLDLPGPALLEMTEARIRGRAGFARIEDWRGAHERLLRQEPGS